MANPNDSSRDQVSILGPSLRFKGELIAEEDLVIRGRVEGSIKHSQRLTVGREGHVKADIHGQIIAVQGTVEGDLTASTSVSVAETAHLTGDIRAPSVSIVDGAEFNGNVAMDAGKSARARQPEVEARTSPGSDMPRSGGER
jgi:cytoskeletal protein CcmA (bactofilin family)